MIGLLAGDLKDEQLAFEAMREIERLNPDSSSAERVFYHLCFRQFLEGERRHALDLAEQYLRRYKGERAERIRAMARRVREGMHPVLPVPYPSD